VLLLDVLRAFPAARSIVQRMRREAPTGGGVERALSAFMSLAESKGHAAYKRDVLALRFYLADVVRSSASAAASSAADLTNQLELVTRLHDAVGDGVTYVSFNYDTLLEDAVNARFGSSIGKDMASYLNGPVRVLKPHGSVNWVEEIPALGPPPPGASYPYMHRKLADLADLADLASNEASIALLDSRQVGFGQSHFHVPAVAVPVADKDAFLMPTGHMDALVEALGATTRLLIVGWRGSELRFQQACQAHLSGYESGLRALVVDKGADESAAGEVIANLSPKLHPRLTQVAYDGFTAALATDIIDRFATDTS
jgi:hypothetical protein